MPSYGKEHMMNTQPKALEIADRCQGLSQVADAYSEEAYREAAAELRRLHAENERLAAEVANRNRRALDGDEAVTALANVHAYYEGLEARGDALLKALKLVAAQDQGCGGNVSEAEAWRAAQHIARTAIALVESV